MNKTVYIIAEVGPNHNGDENIALRMIDEIAKTGVNAIKFQMTNPFKLYSKDSFIANYQKRNDCAEEAIEMSLRHQLSKESHYKCFCRCKELGIDYICTAFDIESLLYLDSKFEMPYYKIASGEIFSLDIIEHMSRQHKPIILSTGMATYEEINMAVNLLNRNFKKDITILHCISNYPAKYEEVNLMNMLELKERFGYEVGFSDHTMGNECAIAAVAMGASMIEKHVTYDKNAEGPDHKASINIRELGLLVDSIRHVEKAIGGRDRQFSESQREISKVARKSCVTTRSMKSGEIIQIEDICYKRPGTGFLPIDYNKVIGKTLKVDIAADKVIKPEFVE